MSVPDEPQLDLFASRRRPATNIPSTSTEAALALRRVFYQTVIGLRSKGIRDDLRRLSKAWLRMTGASWIWFWLKYGAKGKSSTDWELTEVVCADDFEGKCIPEKLVPANNHLSVAQCVADYQVPLFIDQYERWEFSDSDRQYSVVCLEALKSFGCDSFLCLPIAMPRDLLDAQNQHGDEEGPAAVLCAHFARGHAIVLQTEPDYILMGQVTARVLANAFWAQEREVMKKLDALAIQFLTRRATNPKQLRRRYLGKVIELIQEQLRTRYVSIFYRDQDIHHVRCLATTGLRSAAGSLDQDDIGNARYAKNIGLTGRVFATGELCISAIGEKPDRDGPHWTEIPADIREEDMSWVLYPIIRSAPADGTRDRSEVLGVIRCVGNDAALVPGRLRNFDAVQIKLLQFICDRLAPVLETMAMHIQRERMVTMIKHDLENPLISLSDECADLIKAAESGRAPKPYARTNIELALELAHDLVDGLDSSPEQIRDFAPRVTRLEGAIVARVKATVSAYAKRKKKMTIAFIDVAEVFKQEMWLDSKLIERALRNLLTNAVKYGRAGTEIRIVARDDGAGNLCLDVENFGIGVQAEDIHRIFEEDFRSEEARSTAMGLGLGLSIARTIMRKHGGDLVLTRPTEPTIFRMQFPMLLQLYPPAP